ncbi:hypothetical protein K439DRAFT_1620250 [Ramaria rubella]|nr:hypothetical protein K439DRAFT_1620250 [Ramaria rubella]
MTFQIHNSILIIPDAEVQVLLDHFEAALLFIMHNTRSYIDNVELLTTEEMERIMPVVKTKKQPNPAQNISELIEKRCCNESQNACTAEAEGPNVFTPTFANAPVSA